MHLEQVLRRFRKLADGGLVCQLHPGAAEAELCEVEARLELTLPTQVRQFWATVNGLTVQDPALEVLPLAAWSREQERLVFARCDQDVRLAFDTASPNVAGQWTIVNAETGYQITYTMASFGSAHLWTWVVKRRPIWFDVHGEPQEPERP